MLPVDSSLCCHSRRLHAPCCVNEGFLILFNIAGIAVFTPCRAGDLLENVRSSKGGGEVSVLLRRAEGAYS